MQSFVGGTPAWVDRTAIGKRLWAMERQFYQQRQFFPAWIDGNRTTPQMKDLLSQLHYAEKHGLDPATYRVAEFERTREESQTKLEGTRFDEAMVPELDAKMTYAYLRYAADLLGWTSTPKNVSKNWLVSPETKPLSTSCESSE